MLGDFGVAYAGASHRARGVIGTTAYLSPEQARAAPVDARSDLYALGATLYHALCGRPPFVGDAPAVLAQHRQASPQQPSAHAEDVSPALEQLVLRLLAKDPHERPQTASEVAATLASLGARDAGVTAILGREREQRTLHAALEQALSNGGRAIALAGEAGIGKSALARSAATEAERRGATVAWGRAAEDTGAPAYRPWVDALRALSRATGRETPASLAPILEGGAAPTGTPADADAARYALFDAVGIHLRQCSDEWSETACTIAPVEGGRPCLIGVNRASGVSRSPRGCETR